MGCVMRQRLVRLAEIVVFCSLSCSSADVITTASGSLSCSSADITATTSSSSLSCSSADHNNNLTTPSQKDSTQNPKESSKQEQQFAHSSSYSCKDDASVADDCRYWASIGECQNYSEYMSEFCPMSCGLCRKDYGTTSLGTKKDNKRVSHTNDHHHRRVPHHKNDNDGGTIPSLKKKHIIKTTTKSNKHKFTDETQKQKQQKKKKQQQTKHNQKQKPKYTFTQEPRDQRYGSRQLIDDYYSKESWKKYGDSRWYFDHVVMKEPRYTKVRTKCKNHKDLCTYWSLPQTKNLCENDPGFMTHHCPLACRTCEYLHYEARCPLNDPAVVHPDDGWYPGDLQHTFQERIANNPYVQERYQPRVLSRPISDYTTNFYALDDFYYKNNNNNGTTATATATTTTTTHNNDGRMIVGGPWVVVLENFVSQEEATRMIELGAAEGYQRSTDVDTQKTNPDGTFINKVSTGRTSTNAWCFGECLEDPVTRRIQDRIANITGLPEENSEFLQLLKYTKGQFYKTHHDYVQLHNERQFGVRLLTVFLYLNDVEKGGGTNFPTLNITVEPKQGRALIWPSVLNEAPNIRDIRTEHQALPVLAGIKYGANAWIHQKDFKGPSERGCD